MWVPLCSDSVYPVGPRRRSFKPSITTRTELLVQCVTCTTTWGHLAQNRLRSIALSGSLVDGPYNDCLGHSRSAHGLNGFLNSLSSK